MPKLTVITATTMQQKSGTILREVYQQGTHFKVERSGYAIAVIIPISDYERDHPRTKEQPDATPQTL
ncbi:MAG: hypothetical protein H6673_09870 [Anaerolineales bacterium]|nr:hypothetical protein [Anaerolineales bacterium]